MSHRLIPLNIPRAMKGEGRVVVIQREVSEKTKSGLLIPESYREENRPSEADVVEASDRCTQLRVGDHIVYNQYTGCEVKLDGVRYVVMRESDVLAIIETPEEEISNGEAVLEDR